MSWVRRIALALLAIVALPIAAVLGLNAFDEAPTPLAASYGEPRSPAVPEAENGYFALIALGAPEGADGRSFAHAWVEEARAAARANRAERRTEPKRGQRQTICDASQTSCLKAARAEPEKIAAQLEAYREDLARYERLLAYKRYEEVLDFPARVSVGFPPYASVVAAQRAYVVRAAWQAARGDPQAALAAIRSDLAFQQAMAAGAVTVLGKVVAASAAWRDLAFLSDLMETHSTEIRPHLGGVREVLQSSQALVKGMSVLVESEFLPGKLLLRNPLDRQGGAPPPVLLERLAFTLLYKPNATLNREVERLSEVAAVMNLPATQGSAALDRLLRGQAQMTFWDYVDNPAGNLLRRVAIAEDGAEAYGRLRLHDAHAYARLVALQAEVLAADLGADAIGAFVARSDPRFHDPYTQKPMAWDAASRRLSFQAQSRATRQRALFHSERGHVYAQL